MIEYHILSFFPYSSLYSLPPHAFGFTCFWHNLTPSGDHKFS